MGNDRHPLPTNLCFKAEISCKCLYNRDALDIMAEHNYSDNEPIIYDPSSFSNTSKETHTAEIVMPIINPSLFAPQM